MPGCTDKVCIYKYMPGGVALVCVLAHIVRDDPCSLIEKVVFVQVYAKDRMYILSA